jgi:Ca2+-binding RTX toxin-like protein
VLRRALLAACLAALLMPAAASAGQFQVSGSTLVYTANNGDVDQISGFDTGTSYRFTRFGGASIGPGPGCTISPDGQTVDCAKAGVGLVVLSLGDQDDVAVVSANVTVPVRFDGGDGNDGLFGGGGTDVFLGGAGNDNVVSRDGRAEDVNCGDGLDTAISDDADTRTSCEEIEGDADGDGVRRPADCDDTNPAIHPGATDVPDDRIDQDCSGADATNLDRDGDGTPRPQDCDDSNPNIRPGAKEIVGNKVDENCDTRADDFLGLGGVLRNAWAPVGNRTANRVLTAREFPKGTRIELRCKGGGCPFKRVVRKVKGRRAVKLNGAFRNRTLARGATVEVRLTRSARIGRVLRFKIGAPGTPSVEFKCLPPGGRLRDC